MSLTDEPRNHGTLLPAAAQAMNSSGIAAGSSGLRAKTNAPTAPNTIENTTKPQPSTKADPIEGVAQSTSTRHQLTTASDLVGHREGRVRSGNRRVRNHAEPGLDRPVVHGQDEVAVLEAGRRGVDRVDQDPIGGPRVLVPRDARAIRRGVVADPDEHDRRRERHSQQQPER